MKKKRYQMRRKTKAIIGMILCLVLLGANMALRGYALTKNAALEYMEDYYSTGELELVAELPGLSLKNRANYRFYLLEAEDCFAMMSINFSLLYGWLDGPCLIVEKDEAKPLNIAYNDFSSSDDTDMAQIRAFGFVSDPEISRVEVEICFTPVGGHTLEKATMEIEQFIQRGNVRYFILDHTYVQNDYKIIMPPLIANAYNADGELVYSEEINYGQSTSMG